LIRNYLIAFAHLAFCAAAILARPSALIFLRLGPIGLGTRNALVEFSVGFGNDSNIAVCINFTSLFVEINRVSPQKE
jgi:hypothetical protein